LGATLFASDVTWERRAFLEFPSKPETRSLLSTPFFDAGSLNKLGSSKDVEQPQGSTQKSTLFRKLYSTITPTSRTISHALTKRSDTISQTVTRPSPLPRVSPSTVDPASGPSECLVKFNNKVEKELDVEIAHTLFHGGLVVCVKFSRDGKYLAAACFDGKTYIYDVQKGTLTR
jgi:WD40 repeat protein